MNGHKTASGIFYETADCFETNRLPSRDRTGENEPTVTIIVSGRPGFISRDPLGLGGGDVNLYAYVGNNPILFVDPTGLIKLSDMSIEQLQETARGIESGQQLWFQAAQSGTVDALREATEAGTVVHANPLSGSENPIIDRFERSIYETGRHFFVFGTAMTTAAVDSDMNKFHA